MERYDGKTKKDDYIKYALIGAGILVVILAIHLVRRGIYRANHPTPDMTVVVANEAALDMNVEEILESAFSAMVPDLDGNGKSVVDVVGLRLMDDEVIHQNDLNLAGAETDADILDRYMREGPYSLFLLSNRAEGQPQLENYVGMQSATYSYCNRRYCRRLPEDLASEDNPYCVKLTGCKALTDAGWGRVPFYVCIQKDASDQEYELAVQMLRDMVS